MQRVNLRILRVNLRILLLPSLEHPRTLGLDASFVGTVDKDAATLKTEHDALFHAANEGKNSLTRPIMLIVCE